MDKLLLNQWHCVDCEKIFFTGLEDSPELCPYCECDNLEDSMVLEAEPFRVR